MNYWSEHEDFSCSCCDLSVQNESLQGDVIITAGSVEVPVKLPLKKEMTSVEESF